MTRTASDTAAFMILCIVGFFVVASMVAIVVLAFNGIPGGDNVWAGLFSLVTAALGGVTGYMGGQVVERRKTTEEGKT